MPLTVPNTPVLFGVPKTDVTHDRIFLRIHEVAAYRVTITEYMTTANNLNGVDISAGFLANSKAINFRNQTQPEEDYRFENGDLLY